MTVRNPTVTGTGFAVYPQQMHSLFGPGCPWYGLYEKFGPANVKWCESTVCSWTNEPANAWSNLAYLLVALWICWQGRRQRNAQTVAFGGIVFAVGITSFFFHASNNYFSQVVDFIGMFLFVFLLLVFNLRRLGILAARAQWWIYLGFVVGATIAIPVLASIGIPYQILIVLTALGIIGTEVAVIRSKKEPSVSYRPFITAIVFFAVAAACSFVDVKRIVCDPDNHFIQGHALWHVLSAVGVYFVYRFYAALAIMHPKRG